MKVQAPMYVKDERRQGRGINFILMVIVTYASMSDG